MTNCEQNQGWRWHNSPLGAKSVAKNTFPAISIPFPAVLMSAVPHNRKNVDSGHGVMTLRSDHKVGLPPWVDIRRCMAVIQPSWTTIERAFSHSSGTIANTRPLTLDDMMEALMKHNRNCHLALLRCNHTFVPDSLMVIVV